MPKITDQKTITLEGGIKIAYSDSGRGEETLVFIHGLGSNQHAWRKNLPELSKRYRCVALDLPGYGDSDKGDHAFGMSFFADQVDALIRELQLTSVNLVGHSMGGQIGITLALRKPDYLKKLVLLAPAGLETFSAKDHSFFATYVTPTIIQATPVAQIEQNFALNFYEMPADARFMVDDRLALRQDTAAYAYYAQMISQCVNGMLKEPVAEDLAQLSLPTLILFGQQDQLIPNRFLHPELTVTEILQKGEMTIPHARSLLLEAAGHFVQWDRPAAVNKAIISFLDE